MLDLPQTSVNQHQRLRRIAAWVLSAAFITLSAAPAFAEERHDDRRHEEHGRAVERHYDHRYTFEAWHGGRWFHGDHGGRGGWWWVVGGVWYFYAAPVYPYPAPPPTVYVGAVAPVAPAAQYYYWCGRPAGYYPYVSGCHVPWQAVPVAAPPVVVAPAPVAQPPAVYAPPPGAAVSPGPPPGYAPPPG